MITFYVADSGLFKKTIFRMHHSAFLSTLNMKIIHNIFYETKKNVLTHGHRHRIALSIVLFGHRFMARAGFPWKNPRDSRDDFSMPSDFQSWRYRG